MKGLIAYTEKNHVVGLKPVGDGQWRMVGDQVPTRTPLSAEEVHSHLFVPPESKGRVVPNVIVVGSAIRKPGEPVSKKETCEYQWLRDRRGLRGFFLALKRVVTDLYTS